MYRGTTPTHIFNIPFNVSNITALQIIYAQNDEVIILKTKEDCVLEDQTITTTLTQEDTLKFNCGLKVQLQVRVLTTSGDALASKVKIIDVGKCLNDEVLT